MIIPDALFLFLPGYLAGSWKCTENEERPHAKRARYIEGRFLWSTAALICLFYSGWDGPG